MFMPGLGSDALGARVHQDFAAEVNALGHEFRIVTTERQSRPTGESPIGEVLATMPIWRRIDSVTAPWLRTRTVLSSSAALASYLRVSGDFDLLHVEVAYPFGASAMLAAAASRWRG